MSHKSEDMSGDILKVLLTEQQLKDKVNEMGAAIARDYAGRRPMFLGVLKGCFVFMADLVRAADIRCDLDFMCVSSYGAGTTSSGVVKINLDLRGDIDGRDIIVVEDILDSGRTLSYLRSYLQGKGAASIAIATLLDKLDRRVADVKADYFGFVVPDEFVVGYGLDYAEEYRNLPYIGVLKPEVYTS